jgi:predicted DNA repair protein MutK
MVIALSEVADQAFVPRLVILIVVALVLTAVVYGVVAAIVRMDDVGLSLTRTVSRTGQKVGRGLVAGMPKLLSALSAVGTVAMLWVGGHILLVGSDRLGWRTPYDWVHHVEDQVRHTFKPVGGVLAWVVDTGVSAVIGLVAGFIAVALTQLLSCGRRGRSSP